MIITFLVWGRETREGHGTLLGEVRADNIHDAEARAKAQWTRTKHFDIISRAAWETMSEKIRGTVTGPPPEKRPLRIRDHPDGYRQITCRICHTPVVFTRDPETGEWPQRYLPYHRGECQATFNRLQMEYRQRRKQSPPQP